MSNIERDDRLVVVEYEGGDGLFTANSCLTSMSERSAGHQRDAVLVPLCGPM